MISWQQTSINHAATTTTTTKFTSAARRSNHHPSLHLLFLRRRSRRTLPVPPPLRLTTSTCFQQQQQQILLTKAEAEAEAETETETEAELLSSSSATAHKDNEEEEEEEGISGIEVPRQRYISVPKSHLLSAIISSIFHSQPDTITQDFTRFSSCLDSILHAEHKAILEEMRMDYTYPSSSTTHSPHDHDHDQDKDKDNPLPSNSNSNSNSNGKPIASDTNSTPLPFNYNLDFSFFLGSSFKDTTTTTTSTSSSVVVASRFQRAFLKLLQNAQFEELSARDLLLTSSLNTDYLLTLPIYVDWKKASESNAIIFRRGYATEKQKGLLIVEKLDYLQSKLLQGIFFSLANPVGKVGMLIKQAFESASQRQELPIWVERINLWLKDLFSQQPYSDDERTLDNQLVSDQPSISDLPIWLAAQKAIPRYEGFLSSVGPRGRLLRKLLIRIGLIPSTPKTSLELDSGSTTSEHYQRPSFLSRISLGDIWRPATREYCGNDILKMLKSAFSILFSQSTLQEPAFQELILLYSEEKGQRGTDDKVHMPSLKLKIYERIPIPDLQVVFPHKKLSFRILDTVRLDAASILGLLAFFVNYKFENILSSPSAVLLDVIAATAFIVYLARLALGYKQTWDRYQLLVNRTLYEKTLASGFGSVHFLLDASEQQQYKEAILAYAVLLGAKDGQITSRKFVGDTCEKFMYSNFKEKVEMPVDKAMDTLLRLGLVSEVVTDGNIILQALPCSEGYVALKRHWDLLLG